MNARCLALRRLQGRVGLLTTLLFCSAILSLIDAFRGGMFGNNGYVELLPGQVHPISGPMPAGVNKPEEMVIVGEPKDGSVRLNPNAHFSGFWFGGDMWRGTLTAAENAPEAEHVILVKDDARGKQNPILVFRIRVWRDLATKHAHSPSFITRKTGLKPFACAGVLAALGLVAGWANFVLGRRWTRLLAAESCAEIYRIGSDAEGLILCCEAPKTPVAEGAGCAVYHPDGEQLPPAVLVQVEKREARLRVPADHPARTGDVVCFALANAAAPVVEQAGPTDG